MKLADAPAIMLTLHQIQRLVSGSIDIDDLDLNGVAARVFELAELCADLHRCEECAETMKALAAYSPNSSSCKSASSSSMGR